MTRKRWLWKFLNPQPGRAEGKLMLTEEYLPS